MAVYVDRARNPYRGMLMCHMVADTMEELHAMADRVGVSREHFQTGAHLPHYDICHTKRRLAIRAGALEIDRHGLVKMMRERRGLLNL
jgi:hypothetical protein